MPLNTPEELGAVWEAARPMLVRAYAGTRNIPEMARMHERTISIAWHALSLWWFCQTDGRGPYSLGENLRQHIETLKVIAAQGSPFEPNVPHHFAFRGADDVTYVVSAFLAAKLAKRLGIRHLVLQTMLNTPKYTWGVQDLAKARASLRLVRDLESPSFSVMLQPRGGLDYFSPDLDHAKAQLARGNGPDGRHRTARPHQSRTSSTWSAIPRRPNLPALRSSTRASRLPATPWSHTAPCEPRDTSMT